MQKLFRLHLHTGKKDVAVGAIGSITASASGGYSGLYEYCLKCGVWQGSGIFTGPKAGTYSVSVRDKKAGE